MVKWIRKLVAWALVLIATVAGAIAAAYYSGLTLPLYHDLTPVRFQNWTRTARIDAEVEHDSKLARRDGRIHLLVYLQLPEAAGRLQEFLHGGRREVVACGPQKLFMHSLVDGKVTIDGDVIGVAGTVDMELDGPVKLRDDWPASTTMKVGHDRTSVWADVVSLDIANLPQPMIKALLESYSRFAYTREQVFDVVAKSLKPEDAAFLATHRDALDMAFESVRPALLGEILVLDATISVDEGAAFRAIGERMFAAAGDGATALAELLGPSKAHAQLKLDDLRKQLEGAGKDILEDVTGGAVRGEVLEDPLKAMELMLRGLADCRVSF